MNTRLEIASRLLAGMLSRPCSPSDMCPSVSNTVGMADALIAECGDKPSVCELSIIEANAAMVVHIDEQVKRAKASTTDGPEEFLLQARLAKADESIRATRKQLEQEIQTRMIAEDALAQIKEERDKLRSDPLQTGLGPQLKAAIARVDEVERKYLALSEQHERLKAGTMDADLNALRDELNALRAMRTGCQKLVDEWRTLNRFCAEKLEAVLKGGCEVNLTQLGQDYERAIRERAIRERAIRERDEARADGAEWKRRATEMASNHYRVKAAFEAQQKNRIRQEQIIEECQKLADKWATVPDGEYYPVNVLASELQLALEGGKR